VVENVSIDYGGVAIACTTEGVYALENYKNNTSLQRTIQVNGKIKLRKNAYGYDLFSSNKAHRRQTYFIAHLCKAITCIMLL
jgi:hypothetical protein